MLILSKKKKLLIFLIDLIVRLIFLLYSFFRFLRVERFPTPKKILVLELWGIGDIILVTPALMELRRAYPEVKILLLAKRHAADILQHNSLVDEFITYDFPWTKFKGKYKFWQWDFKGLLKLINKLRKESFDLALDARMDFRNNLLMFLSAAKRRVGYNSTGGGYFLTDIVPADCSRPHRINEWINLLKYLGIKVYDSKPKVWISENESKWADDFLASHNITENDLVIGIHPGGRIKTGCWPLGRFGKAAVYAEEKYNAKVIVFIEPNGYGNDITTNGHLIRAKLSLRELISVVSRLSLFICNDSGPMHIATAVNVPLIAIFGSGDLEAFGPYGKGHKIIAKKGVPCRPCYDYCKYTEPFCITEISVEEVLEAMDEEITRVVDQNR